MKKNNAINNKNWMLVEAISNSRVVSNGSWKKKDSALELIRSGQVFQNKEKLEKPFEVVSKGVRYRITKEEARLSLKTKAVEANLGSRYQSSKVSSAFWSSWSDQVLSSMGKQFSFERGRVYSPYKQKTIIKGSFKKYYRVNNRSIKAMRKSRANWPASSGFKEVLYKNMERRLDVCLVRLGYALDLHEARKWIRKGVVKVDNKVIYNGHHLLKAGSLISMVHESLPFTLLKREHLKHFPATWRLVVRPKSRQYKKYRRFTMNWMYWLKKYNDTKVNGDFRPAESRFLKPNNEGGRDKKGKSLIWKRYMFFKNLRRKLMWKSGGYLKKVTKRTFKHPELNLSGNFVYVGVNEVLFTHYHHNKDIRVPLTIAGGGF